MNRSYCIIWSQTKKAWVVVSDLARRCTKGGSGRRRVTTVARAPARSHAILTALPALLWLGAQPAFGSNECGTDTVGATTLNCAAGAYASGITYINSDGLTLSLDDATIVLTNNGASITSANTNTNDVAIDAARFNSITTTAFGVHGLSVANNGASGNSAATMSVGTITTTGGSASALRSEISNANSSATASAAIANGAVINVSGDNSIAARSINRGLGNAETSLTGGEINLSGANNNALRSEVANAASNGTASISMSGGSITSTSTATGGTALFTLNSGQGNAETRMSGGSIEVHGINGRGLFSQIGNANSTGAAIATMTGGAIQTSGTGGIGLNSLTNGLGAATTSLSGPATATITTSGNNADGLRSEITNAASTATASATVNGGTITTSGTASLGAGSVNRGMGRAETQMTSGSITMNGASNARGLLAVIANANSTADAIATVTGGAIRTTGSGAGGINTAVVASHDGQGGNAIASMTAGQIRVEGDGNGLFAEHLGVTGNGGALVSMAGGSIATRSTALRASIGNVGNTGTARAEMSGGTVQTTGDQGHGMLSLTQGAGVAEVLLSGGDVLVSGVNADGLRAESTGGTYDVDVTGGTVMGGSGSGAAIHTMAAGGGAINIGANAIVTAGASSIAIRDGDKAAADLNGDGQPDDNDGDGAPDMYSDGLDEIGGNTAVTTAGIVVGNAIMGLGDDSLNLVGGSYDGDIYGDDTTTSDNDGNDTLRWTGGTWHGTFYGGNGSDTVQISAAGYDGGHVLDGGDDTSTADGWIDRLTVTGVSATTNGANLRNWETVTIEGGALTIADGAWSVGTANEANTGVFLSNGGNLGARGNLQLMGNLTLRAGSDFIGLGAGANTYGIAGFVNNNGRLRLDDGAAGDVLTLGGNYTGSNGQVVLDTVLGDDASATDRLVIQGDASGTTRLIVNNVGGRGAQTQNGILVVDVAGASDAGAFALGQWDYVTATGDRAVIGGAYAYTLRQAGNDWRLVSELNQVLLIDPVDPAPLYQPGVPLYEAYPTTLLALNRVSTLEQRVGMRVQSSEQGRFVAEDGSAFWSRIEVGHNRPSANVSTSSAKTDVDVSRLQLGLDHELHRDGDRGLLAGGLMASVGTVRNSIESVYGNGAIDTDGASVGGTLTWYGSSGFYVDAQVQMSRYRSDLRSDTLGRLADDNDGTGHSYSVELGERYSVSERISATPQFQTVYSKVNFDDFVDPADASVGASDGASVTTRMGLSIDYDRIAERRSHLYAVANFVSDWRDGTRVTVSGTPLYREEARVWAELSFGGTYGWDQGRHAVYFEASAEASLEGPNSRAFYGMVGYRGSW